MLQTYVVASRRRRRQYRRRPSRPSVQKVLGKKTCARSYLRRGVGFGNRQQSTVNRHRDDLSAVVVVVVSRRRRRRE